MKKFFVSKNYDNRLKFINSIDGDKVVIYKDESNPLIKNFDIAINMNKLMNNDYFLDNIVKCDSTKTLVLLDILVKSGIYVHPYGKIFRFTEVAKQTLIIDNFFFRFDEKNIVRPFLFIDTSVFGTSMIGFHNNDNNKVENYFKKIAEYVDCKIEPLKIKVLNYEPSKSDLDNYEKLKKYLIFDRKEKKNKIVNELIKYIDNLENKKKAYSNYIPQNDELFIYSNKPSNKFKIYDDLRNDNYKQITFMASNKFGADNIELEKTKNALERHNLLVRLLNENVW